MSEPVRAMWMRGGTSKGGFFLASELPTDAASSTVSRSIGKPTPRRSAASWRS